MGRNATPSGMAPPVLICDFDGTLTTVDVGDALCERFAPPEWREVDEQWLRGELSLPEAQRRMWSMVRARPEDLVGHAREVGGFREGAEELFEAAASGECELIIASGGFDLYIDALLGDRVEAVRAKYHNRLVPSEGGVRPVFAEDLGCERCAVCKGGVVRRHLEPGRRLMFVGDGSSDRCAAGVAPELFAVAGGRLAEHCAERGIDHVTIEDLDSVRRALAS